LTVNGTKYYKDLKTENDQKDFVKEMMIQISNSIPVDHSRLKDINHFLEFDKVEGNDLLYITFQIDPANDSFNKKSSRDIFNDFIELFNINDDIKTYLDNNNSHVQYIDKKFRPRETSKVLLQLFHMDFFFFFFFFFF